MIYLVDTSWVVHYLRGKEDAMRMLFSLKKEGLAISIITLAELYEGVVRATNPTLAENRLEDFLSGTSILGVDEGICRIFGKEMARLHKEGKPIGDFDLLIASTCLYHDLVLLTDNIKEFERVEGLRLLKR